MTISKIISHTVRPALYEKGTAFMWTDEHISKQLLDIHLDPEVNLASRKRTTILKTIDWIMKKMPDDKPLKILDLGCGPGLYTSILAQRGHDVTGVDISKYSIEYAKKEAARQNLNIRYIHSDYLDLDLEAESFDLVILIYTDLGVLFPGDRDQLMRFVFGGLKKRGMFVFDVLRDNELERKVTPVAWEAVEKGFWRNKPYLALSNSFIYEEQKVILYQHTIIDKDNLEVYRFWTHYFSETDVRKMIQDHGFEISDVSDDVLPEERGWGGNNVWFCVAEK